MIIGGTRFMGPHIVRELHAQGHEVAVFHRGETSTELPEGTTEILGDRNTLDDSADTIRGFAPEVVIDMFLITLAHAEQLIEVLRGVTQRIVAVSSADVYRNYGFIQRLEDGEPDPLPLTEESPLRTSMYPYRSMVKDSSDQLYYYDKIPIERAVLNSPDFEGVVTRLPVVYGPNDYRHRFYSWLRRMSDRRPFIMLGEQQADWSITRGYCENCAYAIALAATRSAAAGRIYNVGEAESRTEREWVDRVAHAMKWTGRIVTLPDDTLPEHLKSDTDWRASLTFSTERLRTELGYREPVLSDVALKRTIDWELAHPPTATTPIEDEYATEDAAIRR